MLTQKCTENKPYTGRRAMKNFFPSRTVSCSVLFCCCSFNSKIKPYNKSFIDQTCSVKMAGYWPRSFFSVLFLRQKKKKKKEKKELDLTSIYLSVKLISCRPLSLGGHVESQENKKLCFLTASLAQTRIQCEACRAKKKKKKKKKKKIYIYIYIYILLRLNMAAE